ncbi:MAG: hypothetical protein WCO06_04840 [Candidatus Roizmanbacteria bacterium]
MKKIPFNIIIVVVIATLTVLLGVLIFILSYHKERPKVEVQHKVQPTIAEKSKSTNAYSITGIEKKMQVVRVGEGFMPLPEGWNVKRYITNTGDFIILKPIVNAPDQLYPNIRVSQSTPIDQDTINNQIQLYKSLKYSTSSIKIAGIDADIYRGTSRSLIAGATNNNTIQESIILFKRNNISYSIKYQYERIVLDGAIDTDLINIAKAFIFTQ